MTCQTMSTSLLNSRLPVRLGNGPVCLPHGLHHTFCIAPRCLPDLPLIRVDLIPGSHTQTFDLACPSGVRCSASREDVGLVREKGAAEMGRRGWASGLFGWRRRPPGGQSAPAASGLTTFGDFTHEELAD